MEHTEQLTVFFDGACHLCWREISHYRKLGGSEKINWVDIADPHFSAKDYNLDPVALNKKIHSLRKGKVSQGVDTFIEIWNEIPRYRWLSRTARNPAIRPVMDIAYKAFATLRPWLPKRKSKEYCHDQSCDF